MGSVLNEKGKVKNGWYKVKEDFTCTRTYGIFYNPTTREVDSEVESDSDDFRNDNWYLYDYPINAEVAELYRKRSGVIKEGDTVKVVKGRKVPIGTIAVVAKIYPFYDKYHRWQCDYVYFKGGGKTNKANCELIFEDYEYEEA